MTGSVERKVLLDTSVIIEPPPQGTASFADLVSVSAVTVGELHYGVGASKDPVEQLILEGGFTHSSDRTSGRMR